MRALLALFVRSLKEDVRAKSTYIVRAALVLLVLFFLWMTHSSPWSGAVGREFFSTIVWIDMFVLSVVGLSYFASAITEEKENETLGLLRMTNLDALSILLGKSTSRLIGALFILAAQLPFMLVAVTMGGLAVQQVLAGFVCLLAYAFLLANLGLMCSVIARRSSVATTVSGVFILGLLVFPWWLYGGGQLAGGDEIEKLLDAWSRATPFVRIGDVLRTGFSGGIFEWQFIASLLAGSICFGVAWLLFDRFADTSDEKPGLGFVAPQATEVTPTQVLAGRAQTPALRWKDYSYVAGGDIAVVVKVLIVVLILIGCLQTLSWGGTARLAVLGGFTTFFTGLFLTVCFALDASRIFKREREQRTLSSLMMLPFSARRIAWEKAMGCIKTSWPAIAGFGISVTIFAFGFGQQIVKEIKGGRSVLDENAFYAVFITSHVVATMLMLPVFVAWLSLRLRWGALPLGGTIWFIGNWIGTALLALLMQEASVVVLPLVSVGLLVGFLKSIPKKLEQLAEEE